MDARKAVERFGVYSGLWLLSGAMAGAMRRFSASLLHNTMGRKLLSR